MTGQHYSELGTSELSREVAHHWTQIEAFSDEFTRTHARLHLLTIVTYAAMTQSWFNFWDWIARGWPLSAYFFKRKAVVVGGGTHASDISEQRRMIDGFSDPKVLSIVGVRGNSALLRLIVSFHNEEVLRNPDIYGKGWDDRYLLTGTRGDMRQLVVATRLVSISEMMDLIKVCDEEQRNITILYCMGTSSVLRNGSPQYFLSPASV